MEEQIDNLIEHLTDEARVKFCEGLVKYDHNFTEILTKAPLDVQKLMLSTYILTICRDEHISLEYFFKCMIEQRPL